MSNRKLTHETYHQTTQRQKSVVSDNNFTYRILLNVLNKHIKIKRGKILDIGCGAGTMSFYLANKGHNILGIDISSKAIKECAASNRELHFKNIKFAQVDFPKELPNEKFDVVIFTEVIEHLENGQNALVSIYKLLKPNGIMILSTPSNKAPLYRFGLTKNFDKRVGHMKRYSTTELSKLIEKNGFKISSTYHTEGIIRNFLFVNPFAGKLVRFVKFFISDFVTFIDNLTIPLFGSSDIIIVARKL